MTLDLFLKAFGTLLSVLGLGAAVYNIVSGRLHAQRLVRERHDTERLDAVCLLAARTEQRVDGLEGRHNSLEARVDRRLEQIAGDVGKVKDLFTDYLIKNH